MVPSKVVLHQAEDWEAWRMEVIALLKRKGCFAAIDNGGQDSTVEQRDKAFGYIVDLVSMELRPVIFNEENPAAIIQKLHDHLFVRSGSNRWATYHELLALQLHEGEPTDRLFTRIDILCERLAAQGESINDGLKSSIVLQALPSAYDTLAAQLDAREATGERLSYEEVRAAARLYETKFKRRAMTEEKVLSANDNRRRSARPKDKCFKCGKPGHYAQACRSAQTITQKDIVCHGCGKTGHMQKNCRSKRMAGVEHAWLIRQPTSFILDTGASSHIVNQRHWLANARDTSIPVQGLAGNARATAVGTLHDFPGQALLVPGASENLMSIRQLTNNGWTASFSKDSVTLTADDGRKIRCLHDTGNLFMIDETCYVVRMPKENGMVDMMLWHRRLGHVGETRLRQACRGMPTTTTWPANLPPCDVCISAKMTRAPVKRSPTHQGADIQLARGERIDVDLIGPMPASHSGYRYALQAIDRRTRMSWTGYLRSKNEAAAAMAKILDNELGRLNRHCARLHADRGGEFTGNDWKQLCQERRIRATYAATGTPEHNGLAERTHRTTVETARALLIDAGLDDVWWVEALKYATMLHNMLPTAGSPNGQAPHEAWTGDSPKLDQLRIFGAQVMYLAPGGRFGKQAQEGIYLGPAPDTSGGAVRVYNFDTNRVVVTRDYKMREDMDCTVPVSVSDIEDIYSDDGSDTDADSESCNHDPKEPEDNEPGDIPFPDAHLGDNWDVPATPHQGDKRDIDASAVTPPEQRERTVRDLKRLHFKAGAALGADQLPKTQGIGTRQRVRHAQQRKEQALLAVWPEPHSYKEAISLPDADEWIASMRNEIEALHNQHVWDIVQREQGTRCVTSKWVFKIKTDENNVPVRHKSRLAARGFTQLPGIDFDAISAPVVSKEAVRTALALACHRGWHMEQFDVDTAYLYAPLDKTIFMEAPDGLLELWHDRLSDHDRQLLKDGTGVLRLNKALYGLKQSGRCWYDTIRKFLHDDMQFTASKSEPCVFVGQEGEILLLYVDDGIIIAPNEKRTSAITDKISQQFNIKRLGVPRHFLGWHIRQSDGHLFISQHSYVEALRDTFGADSYKTTPMVHGAVLPDNGPAGNIREYREMIGSLLFAAIGTRPDIAVATSILSRHMAAPTKAHVRAVRNVISYAATTSQYGLQFQPSNQLEISVYCDASFAPDECNRRSRTGYVVLINGSPVSWRSTLQRQIAHSTAEAEYIAMSDAVREACYVRQLLQEMGHELGSKITVYEDNTTAKIMAEEIATKRSKYIDVRYHFVRDMVMNGTIQLKYCATTDMVADMLTKPLAKDTFARHRDRIMAKGEC